MTLTTTLLLLLIMQALSPQMSVGDALKVC